MSFFRTKSVSQLQEDASSSKLSKNLSVMDLTFLGVGGIIGAGGLCLDRVLPQLAMRGLALLYPLSSLVSSVFS